jgi:endonuclease YncB( thermonuclease family)
MFRRPRDLFMTVLTAALLLAAIWWLDGGLPGLVAGPAQVVDGDSLVIGGQRIRLADIDAVEGPQRCRRDGREWPCGEAATRALRQLIGGREVSCTQRDVDRYQRIVADCMVDGTDLGTFMVSEGYAVSLRGYGAQEAAARRAGKGIWAGEFEPPYRWRERNR